VTSWVAETSNRNLQISRAPLKNKKNWANNTQLTNGATN